MNWTDGCVELDVNWHPGPTQPAVEGLHRETLKDIRHHRHPAAKQLKRAGLDIMRVIEERFEQVFYVDEVRESHVFAAAMFVERALHPRTISHTVSWLRDYQLKQQRADKA